MSFASFVWTFSERKAKLECVMQFFFFLLFIASLCWSEKCRVERIRASTAFLVTLVNVLLLRYCYGILSDTSVTTG